MKLAAKAKDDAILAALARLALHYWRPDFTPQQAKHVYADFLCDLREFAVKDVLAAIKAYRRAPESKFFPHPGALRSLLETPPHWWTTGQRSWLAACRQEARDELETRALFQRGYAGDALTSSLANGKPL